MCTSLVQGEGYYQSVAVKELRRGSDAFERRHFMEEAQLMGNFCHENIARLLGVVRDKERVRDWQFFFMEGRGSWSFLYVQVVPVKWGLCGLRHAYGIPNSMETILTCHPALSTE